MAGTPQLSLPLSLLPSVPHHTWGTSASPSNTQPGVASMYAPTTRSRASSTTPATRSSSTSCSCTRSSGCGVAFRGAVAGAGRSVERRTRSRRCASRLRMKRLLTGRLGSYLRRRLARQGPRLRSSGSVRASSSSGGRARSSAASQHDGSSPSRCRRLRNGTTHTFPSTLHSH